MAPELYPALQADLAAQWMARALHLAGRGRATTFPNPRVGCVIVRKGVIVGEGWHERAGQPHAEIHALRQAGESARGADLFVTLEPCSHHGRTPPCADALIAAGVRRVHAAMRDPNPVVAGQGIERLLAAGIEVKLGLCESAARELNRGFISRIQRRRPYLTLKLAASLDGRTGMASGESKWISGDAARADVHRLRAEAGAVLTSSSTVLADDPALTARLGAGPVRQPDRIVLDARARVPQKAQVWNEDGARRFWLAPEIGAVPRGVRRINSEARPSGRLELAIALTELARLEVNSVLVECGPSLAGALLQERLVDEFIIYLAPKLLGDAARGLARLPGLERLADNITLHFADVRQVGADLRITAVPGVIAP